MKPNRENKLSPPNHPIFHFSDLAEGESKGFSHNDFSFFAVKKNNHIFLYKNACPHLGIELEWKEDDFLDAEGELIQCATHGALFIIEDGACVAGPCIGQQLQRLDYKLDSDGYVVVELPHNITSSR